MHEQISVPPFPQENMVISLTISLQSGEDSQEEPTFKGTLAVNSGEGSS